MNVAIQNLGDQGRKLVNKVPPLFLNTGRNFEQQVIDRQRMYEYLIANDLLREDEAREIDEALIRVADRDRVGVEDLRARGLIKNLRNIGVTTYQWERMSAVEDAIQHMSIRALGDRDRVAYTLSQVPVPVTSSQFELDRRNVEAGRTRGQGVDVTNVEEHTRAAIRRLESTLTNGNSAIVLGGNALQGYTNFTPRQKVTLSDNWDTVADRKEISADVLEMRRVLRADGFDGPYILYIPPNYDGVIDDDYQPGSGSSRTVRERLLAIDGVDDIKVLPSLADDNVLLVQMTRSVVEYAVGQELTTVTWDLMGGLATRWAILEVSSFALKTAEDEDGSTTSGIAHLS